MYTRCPSCRAEISFEPPRNLANLPQGYKHRIRCPNCGVTISVKIPNTAVVATPAPSYSYENPNQQGYNDIQVGVGTPQTGAEEKAVQESAKKANKKAYGRGKAAVLFIISLLFIAVATIAYLHTSGTNVPVIGDLCAVFNPIKFIEVLIKDSAAFFDTVKQAFAEYGALKAILYTVYNFAPAVIFVLAGLTAITNLLVLVIGKYNGAAKAFGVIFTLVMFVLAVVAFVAGYFVYQETVSSISFVDYLKTLIENKGYITYAVVGLTFIAFILACIFTGKTKNEKRIKGIVDEE